jgi:hypothetical protein
MRINPVVKIQILISQDFCIVPIFGTSDKSAVKSAPCFPFYTTKRFPLTHSLSLSLSLYSLFFNSAIGSVPRFPFYEILSNFFSRAMGSAHRFSFYTTERFSFYLYLSSISVLSVYRLHQQ